jgi:hypothetical protein
MRPQPKIDHHCKDSQGCDFCTIYQMRSPAGAKRNPGLPRGVDAAQDFAALNPGYARFHSLVLASSVIVLLTVKKLSRSMASIELRLTLIENTLEEEKIFCKKVRGEIQT